MSNQLKLGIFAVVGVFAIFVSIFAVGSFSFKKTYCVYAKFNSVSGLTEKAKVKMAGVNIGVLKGVSLEDSRAKLKLLINKNIVLHEGDYARIVSMGIIGTKYIEIVHGGSNAGVLKEGDYILSIENQALEEALFNITNKIGKALGDEKSGDMMKNLAEAIHSLKCFLESFASGGGQVSEMIVNFNKFSKDITDISANNKKDLQDTILMIKNAALKLNTLIERMCDGDGTVATLINNKQMSEDLKETIVSVKNTTKSLNDTICKTSKFKLSWNYTGRYNTRTGEFGSDIGITIMPNNHRFYYIGVSNVSDNSESKEANGKKSNVNKLEALLGIRSENSEVYLGAMRGKGGIGFGYSFLQPIYSSYKTLEAHLDMYDFTRKAKGPVFSAGVRFGITKWLYVGVTVEDIAYTPAVGPYLKISI